VSTPVSCVCVSTGLFIKRACLSGAVCSSFLSYVTSCLYYESTACQTSLLVTVFYSAFARPVSVRLCSLFGIRSASDRSSPWHLSKWSHVLDPTTLVQVVAHSRLRDTCLSGHIPSSPWHLSKWSHTLCLWHLSKWLYVLVPAALV
jgi:hypothetical protein